MSVQRGRVSLNELYSTLIGLSYDGDLRTRLGFESADKIARILSREKNDLNAIYAPLLEKHCVETRGDFLAPYDASRLFRELQTRGLGIVRGSPMESMRALRRLNFRSSLRLAWNQCNSFSLWQNARYVLQKIVK